ncbi:MAG TPA: hypothetical protein VF599_16865 [Pyrinomonadaceae bacterium]
MRKTCEMTAKPGAAVKPMIKEIRGEKDKKVPEKPFNTLIRAPIENRRCQQEVNPVAAEADVQIAGSGGGRRF